MEFTLDSFIRTDKYFRIGFLACRMARARAPPPYICQSKETNYSNPLAKDFVIKHHIEKRFVPNRFFVQSIAVLYNTL